MHEMLLHFMLSFMFILNMGNFNFFVFSKYLVYLFAQLSVGVPQQTYYY